MRGCRHDRSRSPCPVSSRSPGWRPIGASCRSIQASRAPRICRIGIRRSRSICRVCGRSTKPTGASSGRRRRYSSHTNGAAICGGRDTARSRRCASSSATARRLTNRWLRSACTLRSEVSASAMNVVISPARTIALSASAGATDFGEYFTYFSFFLVVSALLLVVLFFKLGVEQRLRQMGILRASGFTMADIRRLTLGEGSRSRARRRRAGSTGRRSLCQAHRLRASHVVDRGRGHDRSAGARVRRLSARGSGRGRGGGSHLCVRVAPVGCTIDSAFTPAGSDDRSRSKRRKDGRPMESLGRSPAGGRRCRDVGVGLPEPGRTNGRVLRGGRSVAHRHAARVLGLVEGPRSTPDCGRRRLGSPASRIPQRLVSAWKERAVGRTDCVGDVR